MRDLKISQPSITVSLERVKERNFSSTKMFEFGIWKTLLEIIVYFFCNRVSQGLRQEHLDLVV